MKILKSWCCRHGRIRQYEVEMEAGEIAAAPQIEYCEVCDADTVPLDD
jgi:hypothetical protein